MPSYHSIGHAFHCHFSQGFLPKYDVLKIAGQVPRSHLLAHEKTAGRSFQHAQSVLNVLTSAVLARQRLSLGVSVHTINNKSLGMDV